MATINSKAGESIHTKTLEAIVRWCLYACALIPLIIFKEFLSPFHFGKVIVFRIFIEIVFLFYVALVLTDRSFLPRPTRLFWAVTAFIAAYGITSLTGINVYQSVVGTLERMGGWFTLVHFWLMFIMMISVLRTREDWIRMAQISLLASLWSAFYGFLQKSDWQFIIGSGDRGRIFGTLGNTALFAGYLIVNTFIALTLFFRRDTWNHDKFWKILWLFVPFVLLCSATAGNFGNWLLYILAFVSCIGVLYAIVYVISTASKNTIPFMRFLYALTFVANTVAIFMTAVRGSMLAMFVALGLFALFTVLGKASRRVKISFITFIAVLILIEGALVSMKSSDFVRRSGYLSRITDVTLNSKTVQTRFWAWRAGINGWNDSAKTMLLGWGPENFNIPFSVHFNPKFFTGIGSETLFDRAHNMFVEVLVTMGVFGLFFYASMFGVLFWMFAKMYRNAKSTEDRLVVTTLICGLVAYIIHNCFIFDTSANFIAFFTFAAFSLHMYESHSGEVEFAERTAARKAFPATMRYTIVLLLFIPVAILIYKTDILPVKANYATTRGIVASWGNDHVKANQKFQEAVKYDVFPIYEIRHRYAQYVLENYGRFKPETGLNAGDVILNVIDIVKKNTVYKLDYLPYLYISRAYIILGKDDRNSPYNDLALENSQKALDISPAFIRTYYEVAQAYLNKKDYKNALATFQKAIDLNPSVPITWWYRGVTLAEFGDTVGAIASLKKADELGYNSNNEGDIIRLINIYAKVKDYETIEKLYLQIITIQPNNPQYHASLAQVYVELNQLDKAVAEARIAVKLDPSFEPDAKKFVEDLGRTW